MKLYRQRLEAAGSWMRQVGFRLPVRFLLVAVSVIPMPGTAWALTETGHFGSNPGNLRMYRYVPPNLPSQAPLVVALHGCTQAAADYDDETGWVKLADAHRFALLLPEQRQANNFNRCFSWFESADIQRDQGEVLSIKQMIDRMKSDHDIATGRVYITGLSAGGAMTAVMLATYPEVFAGGAIVAGIPYRCATSAVDAFNCMKPGKTLSPSQWGNKVRSASSYQGPWPIVSIWHGDADAVVKISNLTESLKQWTNVHGIDAVPDREEAVAGYPRKVYQNSSGRAVVETYTITGMDHGTPVDPGTSEKQCGKSGPYILDKDICASHYISQFWGLTKNPTPVLSVRITSPNEGASVSGIVPIAADVTAPAQRVEFYLAGKLIAEDATAPYAYSWDTANVEKGSHQLMAKAFEVAGDGVASQPVSITVNGGEPTTRATFRNQDRRDGYVKANADGSLVSVGQYESRWGLAIGRGTDGQFNRAVLSFDTSPIPDSAAITKAYLQVMPRSASGDPWADPTGNQLVLDIKRGCFADCAIEARDWSAPATASGVAKFAPFTSGGQYSEAFNAEGLAAINKTGITQIRLRFSDNQNTTNYLWLDHGAKTKLYVDYVRRTSRGPAVHSP